MINTLINRLAYAVSPANKRHRSHKAFIFVAFALPLMAFAIVSAIHMYGSLTELSLARRQAIALPTALALEQRVDRLVGVANSFAIHPQIRELAQSGEWENTKETLQIFKLIIDDPFIDRIFLTNAEGTLMAGIPEIGTEGQNFAFRDWYQGILSTGKPYLSKAYRRTVEPQYNVVALAIPVVDEKNLMMAILVLQIRLDHFLEWSKDIEIGEGGFVYMVDQAGQVVSHPHFAPQGQIADFSSVQAVQKLLQGQRGVEAAYNPVEHVNEVVAYEPVPKYGWGVVVQQPAETVFAARNKEMANVGAMYSLLFLVNAFLVYLLLGAIAHYQNEHDTKRERM